MNVGEDGGLEPGYSLKLNSYDLGVDIELADAIQRLRFSHPVVRALVVTSLRDRMFCAGANIFMLGQSSHAFKVNFCKFTNETRLYLEELARGSRIRTLAASTARPRAAATSSRWLATRSCWSTTVGSAVSLPEVRAPRRAAGHRRAHARRRQAPGSSRSRRLLLDDRRGRARRSAPSEWRLIDELVPRSRFQARVAERAAALAAESDRPSGREGRRASAAPAAGSRRRRRVWPRNARDRPAKAGGDGDGAGSGRSRSRATPKDSSAPAPTRGPSPPGASSTTRSSICA